MASVLTGLDHIQLPVADLAASIAWYQRLLGFRVLTDYGTSAMLRAEGGPDLMLWEAPGHAPMKLTVAGRSGRSSSCARPRSTPSRSGSRQRASMS